MAGSAVRETSMLKRLRERFGWAKPEPSPAIPVSDHLLADEGPVTEADVTACITEVRARRNAPPRDSTRIDLLLAIGAAEQFAAECLDYGPEQTHHAKPEHLAKAIQTWAVGRGRVISDPKAFLAALLTLLEFRGGHRAQRRIGEHVVGELFVGCKLNEDAIAMLNRRASPQRSIERNPQLSRVLGELLG